LWLYTPVDPSKTNPTIHFLIYDPGLIIGEHIRDKSAGVDICLGIKERIDEWNAISRYASGVSEARNF